MNPKKSTTNRTTAARQVGKEDPDEVGALIHLLEEVNHHLSTLNRAYEQSKQAFQEAIERVSHLEDRFSRLDAVLSRLELLESEVHDLTRGYLERLEAMERRQAAIESTGQDRAA
ncbi:MAG: hypothetical protein HY282_09825 [Nitrospirae bacterium]|nr:hypothetical protein [Candidatus Manganitrophaceae bacterium]